MSLKDIFEAHKIYSIKALVKATGWTTQQAWYIWHGKTRLRLSTAKVLVEKKCATWEELAQLQEEADTQPA
jgi:hypothetical protein